jgi:hypothetical protein
MGQRVSSCIAPRFACSNSVPILKSQPNDSFNLQKHPQDCEKLKSQEKDSFYLQIHQELNFPCKLNFLKKNSFFFFAFLLLGLILIIYNFFMSLFFCETVELRNQLSLRLSNKSANYVAFKVFE